MILRRERRLYFRCPKTEGHDQSYCILCGYCTRHCKCKDRDKPELSSVDDHAEEHTSSDG